jgi:hypothetical protein
MSSQARRYYHSTYKLDFEITRNNKSAIEKTIAKFITENRPIVSYYEIQILPKITKRRRIRLYIVFETPNKKIGTEIRETIARRVNRITGSIKESWFVM